MAIDESGMHYKDYRSGQLTNGIERIAHRALLYSTGLDEEDLRKPMIAVVNSYTEMVPGHYHLKELAEFVKMGIRVSMAMGASTNATLQLPAIAHEGAILRLPESGDE